MEIGHVNPALFLSLRVSHIWPHREEPYCTVFTTEKGALAVFPWRSQRAWKAESLPSSFLFTELSKREGVLLGDKTPWLYFVVSRRKFCVFLGTKYCTNQNKLSCKGHETWGLGEWAAPTALFLNRSFSLYHLLLSPTISLQPSWTADTSHSS